MTRSEFLLVLKYKGIRYQKITYILKTPDKRLFCSPIINGYLNLN
jgi:hypothetical protein